MKSATLKKILITVLLQFVLMWGSLFSIGGYKDIEVVESIPEGTVLDNPDIRNAPEVWVQMINSARKSIDIAQFYVSNDTGSALDKVIKALRAAGDRGVRIRFLIDKQFYENYPADAEQLAGIKNLILRKIDYGKIAGGVMHAKYFVIDGKTVFLGSQNFDWRALSQIHEIGVKIENKEFAEIIEDIFNMDWRAAGGVVLARNIKNALRKYDLPIRVNEGSEEVELWPVAAPHKMLPSKKLFNERRIIELLKKAQKEVFIHVMTYSPVDYDNRLYLKLDNAIREAASRGVMVSMIVADWSTFHPAIDYLKSLAVLPNIDIKITSIPQLPNKFIPYSRVEHCKYMVVDDDYVWIGSSNWTRDYFYKSRNVGVVIKSKKINSVMREVFYKSWNSPYASYLDISREYKPPRKK